MKIAISNLAWEKSEDRLVLNLLDKYNIKGLEIAATKIWDNPTQVSKKEIVSYKKFWENNGINIIATTSLLFGHPELTIFEDKSTRNKTLLYLYKMIELSSLLGAKAMVFGSPKNRSLNGVPIKEATKLACDFFYKVGEKAKEYNLYFGIEPNSPVYGTDFVTTTQEGIELVKKISHPNFRLHLDTSTMALNGEDYKKSISQGIPLACHFHISEPFLKPVPLPSGGVNHNQVAEILRSLNYSGWVSVEMPLPPTKPHLGKIENSLVFVTSIYKEL